MKKVKVTLWNQDTRQNEYKDAMLLHWGISYEELPNGIGHYTVAFAMLSDGKVIEVHPANIKFEVDEELHKIEAAELLDLLIKTHKSLVEWGVELEIVDTIEETIKKLTE